MRSLWLSAVVLALALVVAAPAAAEARCPTQAVLGFGHLVYVAADLPAESGIASAQPLGEGTFDEPTDASGCKRRQASVGVEQAGEIDPRVAVMAEGRPGTLFILGARCAGYGAQRWACLRHPLEFGGLRYTGTRHPVEPAPDGAVPVGAPLGAGRLAGEAVSVARIEGVAPSLAVAVEGRPTEVFLAPGVCPYEAFDGADVGAGLLGCLRSPAWLSFDPPGASVGTEVRGQLDRPLGAGLEDAVLALTPRGDSGAVQGAEGDAALGPLAQTFSFVVPDVPLGFYDVVVTCAACGDADGEATRFRAGSFLVSGKPHGSSGARSITIGLAALVLLAGTLLVRRRRRARRVR